MYHKGARAAPAFACPGGLQRRTKISTMTMPSTSAAPPTIASISQLGAAFGMPAAESSETLTDGGGAGTAAGPPAGGATPAPRASSSPKKESEASAGFLATGTADM